MFSTNSSWANPQQNQQQQPQQQGSAFGQPNQPSAFGSGGAFGGTAFGQTQQQPQPAANPMFGGLGGSASNNAAAGSSGFGAFGANNSSFAAKPTTGFGAFGGGGTSAFGGGGTSAFGSTANPASTGTGSNLFGQSAGTGTTSTFGSGGGGLFAAKPAGTVFGSTTPAPTGGLATDPNAATAAVTTGSSNPPYSVSTEKEAGGAAGSGPVTLHYQSISTMPAYRGSSFEELRLQDYAQGRKTAGGFGQSATFGINPAPSQSTANTSIFGQQQPAAPAAPTTSTAFGTFGQGSQPNQTTGTFGQSTGTQPSAFGTTGTTGGGLFGTFGQNQQQQQQGQQGTGAFGTFGQNTQQPQQSTATGGLFGTGTFGQNAQQQQNKPFGGFGGGNAFSGTTSAFGQNTNQQQQPASTGSSIFGQPQPQQGQQPNAFGSFGTNSNAPKPSLFGTQPTQQPNNSFGLFGQNQQNQQGQPQQPQQGGGLFGNTGLFGQQNQNQQPGLQQSQQQQPQQGGSLFGTAQPAQQPGGGLFSGSNLFNNPQQQQGTAQKPAFGGGIFGQPATGSLANNGTAQGQQTSIFGQPLGQSTAQPSTGTGAFGGSLFGNNKPATTTGLFGQASSQPSSNTLGGSFLGSSLGGSTNGFGQSASGQGNQGTLTASVAQPVSTNLPIFNLLPPGPRAVALDQQPKKASSYFIDVPTRSPLNMSTGRVVAGKLRGFGSTQAAGSLNRSGNPFSSSLSFSSTHSNASSLTKTMDSRGMLGPEAFLGSPTLGSGGKPSPKKLVLDRKVEPSDIFGKSGLAGSGTKITFSPVMGAAARERELLAASKMPAAAQHTTPAKSTAKTGQFSALGAQSTTSSLGGSRNERAKVIEKEDLQEGDYWVKPSLDVLRNASNVELSSFKDLRVGRVGFGEVQFLEPVDLTTLPRLSALLGKLIQIDNKECCVYPDSVDGDDMKPQPGEGINVRARILLLGCWPMDKATREPIKDEKHPAFARHLKRLKNIKHTQFESYNIDDGKWTFTVDHF